MKNNLTKTRWFIYGTYILLVLTILLIGSIVFVILNKGSDDEQTFKSVFVSFFETAENRTFDYRQHLQMIKTKREPSDKIAVLEIDDATVESLWEKYGEWPAPRNIYADLVNYLEKDKPQAIVFDLMFLKSINPESNSDKLFVETLNKYDNIYVGITFDDREEDVRKPMDLPDKLKVNVNNTSNTKFKEYSNCRPIMQELFDSEKINVESVNVERDADGILRKVPPVLKYKNDFYTYLGFKVGVDYLQKDNKTQFYVDKNRNLVLTDAKIPLTKKGEAILNWYYNFDKYSATSFYKVLKDAQAGKANTNQFKGKFIFIGTTADALYDIKSVPINARYPGVYVQATTLNNLLDNNFVHKTDVGVDIFITICVVMLVGVIVMFSTSTLFATLSTILFSIAYGFISYYLLERCNLWIPVVLPSLAIVTAYILSLLAKYLMKSRDFEYQYKLATIDGLTELYNHRYFQDTLKQQMDIARRYNQSVSLIICDIDFFKKFNDTYGHQAGDAVLRQVAQTLKKNSRTTDYVCRYGGEEMSIILPNTKTEEALQLANRICAAVSEKPFHLTPVDTAPVTISLGVSTFPDNAQTPQDLIEWADKGLYYAKEHGRNQVGRY